MLTLRTGRKDEVTTGANGRWAAEIYGPGPVLQARVGGGGPGGPVRWADTTPDAHGSECCHNVRHVRGHPPFPGDPFMTTLRKTHFFIHIKSHKDRQHALPTPQP